MVRTFKRLVRGWSVNLESFLTKHKKELMAEYDRLDILAESQILYGADRERMDSILRELSGIWRKDEIKAIHRSGDRDIMEGGRNTMYFHVVDNQRRRMKLINVLDDLDGPVTDKDGLKKNIY